MANSTISIKKAVNLSPAVRYKSAGERIGVFIDIENANASCANVQEVLSNLMNKGRIVYGKFYGYTDDKIDAFEEIVLENRFETVGRMRNQVVGVSMVNTRLIMDVIQMAQKGSFDTVFVWLGRGDWIPFLSYLCDLELKVITVALPTTDYKTRFIHSAINLYSPHSSFDGRVVIKHIEPRPEPAIIIETAPSREPETRRPEPEIEEEDEDVEEEDTPEPKNIVVHTKGKAIKAAQKHIKSDNAEVEVEINPILADIPYDGHAPKISKDTTQTPSPFVKTTPKPMHFTGTVPPKKSNKIAPNAMHVSPYKKSVKKNEVKPVEYHLAPRKPAPKFDPKYETKITEHRAAAPTKKNAPKKPTPPRETSIKKGKNELQYGIEEAVATKVDVNPNKMSQEQLDEQLMQIARGQLGETAPVDDTPLTTADTFVEPEPVYEPKFETAAERENLDTQIEETIRKIDENFIPPSNVALENDEREGGEQFNYGVDGIEQTNLDVDISRMSTDELNDYIMQTARRNVGDPIAAEAPVHNIPTPLGDDFAEEDPDQLYPQPKPPLTTYADNMQEEKEVSSFDSVPLDDMYSASENFTSFSDDFGDIGKR